MNQNKQLPDAPKKVRVAFGLQEANIDFIEHKTAAFPGALYSYHVWQEIGKEIGWDSLTAALWYFQKLSAQEQEAGEDGLR